MIEAYKYYSLQNTGEFLVMIATPLWNEAIIIRDSQIQGHIAAQRGNPSLWNNSLKSLYKDTQKLIAIAKDIPRDDPELEETLIIFPESQFLDWKEIAFSDKFKDKSNKFKNQELFKPKEKRIKIKNLIVCFLLMQNLSIFFTLKILERKTIEHLQQLKVAYMDNREKSEEARHLLGEIAEYMDAQKSRSRQITPFTAIAEIYRLEPEALIRALTIQKNRIDLEMEGVDSCKTIDILNSSTLFSNIMLHEASPSALRGDRFSLSGIITYE